MKIIKLFCCISFFLVSSFTLTAQLRNCDLSVNVESPSDNYELPFGDTSHIIVSVKNNGIDSILRTDTIKLAIMGFPGLSIFLDTVIAPGDSILWNILSGWANSSQLEDDTSTLCFQLMPTSTFTDLNIDNNETCITTIFKGANSVGIGDRDNRDLFSIYPNPVNDYLIINNTKELKIESVTVIDLMGRRLLQIKPIGNTIDLKGLREGVYFLRLESAEYVKVLKFIKVNK